MNYKNTVSLFLISFLAAIGVCQSQVWTQLSQDINTELNDDSNKLSVSLNSDGSILAVGAVSFNQKGNVRIYQNQNGNWSQIGQNIEGADFYDWFGGSVSLSSDGSVVAIGAFGNDANGVSSGHVRIYQYQDGNWSQIGQDIEGEAEGDEAGCWVSLNGDGSVVAIGAPFNDGNGIHSGHARVFHYQDGNWSQIGQDIDGEAADDRCGTVSLNSDGTVLAVGAIKNDGNGSESGHVRIYQYQNGSWSQIGQDINGEAANDFFGRAVSSNSDGSMVAIGAPNNDGNGYNSGHVRIYQYENGNWSQIGQDIDGEAENDLSGYTVSLNSDGSMVAIGAYSNDGNGYNSGHTRIYQNQNGSWLQIGQDIDGEAEGDESGSSVSLSSDSLVVAISAPYNDGIGNNSGHVRVYKQEFVSVETLLHKGISIYPNPTNRNLHFEFANNDIKSLSISDINGKQIIEEIKIQQNSIINLSGFDSGIYLITIQTNNETINTKIVKR